jgi:hypothetical protein
VVDEQPGCSQDNCGTPTRIHDTMVTIMTATAAPIGCSVSVEMNRPTAASAERPP